MAPYEEGTRDLLTGAWSEHLESVRKDVECTFGILKKRFGLLRAPLLVRRKDKVEDIVWTACWLHNVLLSYDYDDDDDAFLEGFGDEGDLDDKDYRDVAVDAMMRAVLQEWCCEDGDDDHDGDAEAVNANLTRFRVRRRHLVSHFRDAVVW